MHSKLAIASVGSIAFCAFTLCSAREASSHAFVDPCSLLTQAQASAVFETGVEPPTPVGSTMCVWKVPNQPNSMNGKKIALVIIGVDKFNIQKTPVTSRETMTPVTGIGDEAMFFTLAGATPGLATSLSVRKGNTAFSVHVYGIPDKSQAQAQERTLAMEIVANL